MVHGQMVRPPDDCAAGHRFQYCSENSECCFREAYRLTDKSIILVQSYCFIPYQAKYPITKEYGEKDIRQQGDIALM